MKTASKITFYGTWDNDEDTFFTGAFKTDGNLWPFDDTRNPYMVGEPIEETFDLRHCTKKGLFIIEVVKSKEKAQEARDYYEQKQKEYDDLQENSDILI